MGSSSSSSSSGSSVGTRKGCSTTTRWKFTKIVTSFASGNGNHSMTTAGSTAMDITSESVKRNLRRCNEGKSYDNTYVRMKR